MLVVAQEGDKDSPLVAGALNLVGFPSHHLCCTCFGGQAAL